MDTDCMNLYIVQFLIDKGNGWAIVRARNANEVSSIMENQSHYKNIKIVGIQEKPFMPLETHIIYEGAVTTQPTPEAFKIDSETVEDIINTHSFATETFVRNAIDEATDEIKAYINSLINPQAEEDT